jgi:hypothetical protein
MPAKTKVDHTLEHLLAYNDQVYHLGCGWWLKFVVKRVEATTERPHGLEYSFTLHDEYNQRVAGIDNAHAIKVRKGVKTVRTVTWDHLHRTKSDSGRPYVYTDAAKLIEDFFDLVETTLVHHGHEFLVDGVTDKS